MEAGAETVVAGRQLLEFSLRKPPTREEMTRFSRKVMQIDEYTDKYYFTQKMDLILLQKLSGLVITEACNRAVAQTIDKALEDLLATNSVLNTWQNIEGVTYTDPSMEGTELNALESLVTTRKIIKRRAKRSGHPKIPIDPTITGSSVYSLIHKMRDTLHIEKTGLIIAIAAQQSIERRISTLQEQTNLATHPIN